MKKINLILVVLFALFCIVPYSSADPADNTNVVSETESEEEITVSFPEWVDEDMLDDNYIGRIMPSKTRLRATRLSGLSLSEPNRSLYMAMKKRISKVAAGEETSTIFTVPASEVFSPYVFTAEDLGVSSIDSGSGTSITAESAAAFSAVLDPQLEALDFTAVMQCLMNDCPYELYWFNKSYTVPTQDFRRGAYRNKETGLFDRLVIIGNFIVTLHVSQDYAKRTSNEGTVTYSRNEIDPVYGLSVQAAAENAAEILDRYAGMSDYEKLCGYRDEICGLASYNYAAVTENWPYGDPWQLIWVFDGKPNTQVVCEGYAKAFQYLAGLSTKDAIVITVQGRIPEGVHMWNVVTIDGFNYLTDLTNQDAGYDLFMKGSTDGALDTGYYINNGYGTTKYTYNEGLGWSDEELTLSSVDYIVRKAAVEKVPEIQVSSDTIYPGYAAAVRLTDEDPEFPASAILLYTVIEGQETVQEIEMEDGIGFLSVAGEYYFTVIRDGIESPATEPVTITTAVLPEGAAWTLPAGSLIQSEAFAGDESIAMVIATDCTFDSGAFSDAGVEFAVLSGDCSFEQGSFDSSLVLGLDEDFDWVDGYRFVVRDTTAE